MGPRFGTLVLAATLASCASKKTDAERLSLSEIALPSALPSLGAGPPVSAASESVAAPTEPPKGKPCPPPAPARAAGALTVHGTPAEEWAPDVPFERVDSQATKGFPATSEDGTRMVELGIDGEDFSGRPVDRVRFRALPSGRVLFTFTLYDQRELQGLTPAATRAAFIKRQHDWQQAADLLAKSNWVPMRRGTREEEGCGAWSKLDAEQSFKIVRFDEPDLGVSLDPPTVHGGRTISFIRMTTRGAERAHVAVTIPFAGTTILDGRRAPCGGAFDLRAGFISPDGKTVLLLPENSVGGDNCKAALEMDTWFVAKVN